ncbi:glycoside hydrolase [Gorgonomyces haynaldii]|nr:glycoside hydrolase [Gorgonomyces haynaldii]
MLFTLVAAQVNINDGSSVSSFAKQATQNLVNYYKSKPGPDGQGAVLQNPSGDVSGVQWWESGVYWGTIFEYARVFKDNSFGNDVANALSLASYGQTGSFLGALGAVAATLQGKWNDDIMWWGLASVTGAEIFGKDTKMPGGKTFLQVAQQTYEEAWQQYDPSTCGGGIYWSRDRQNPKTKGYKSTITNVQHMMLGARLFLLTGNQTYIQNSQQLYNWMKRGLIANGKVFDGVDADQGCGMNINEHSYNPGVLLGAMGWLYKATNNQQWVTDASVILRQSLATFSSNNIVTDPCEPRCPANQLEFKGPYVQGLGYYAAFTNNQQDKQTVLNALKTSFQSMLPTCDSNAGCNMVWTAGAQKTTNFHTQIVAHQLITAYATAASGSLSNPTFQAPTTVAAPATDSKSGAIGFSLAGLLATYCYVLVM